MKKGSIIIFALVALVLVFATVSVYFYFQTKKGKVPASTNQITQQEASPIASPKQSPVAVDETANWKKFENSKLSIVYPPNWVIDNSFPDQFDVAFKSSDYAEDAAPNVTKGFKVYLYVNRGQGKQPSTLGLVTTEPQTWLGKKATLEKNNWEGAYIRLWTNDNADLSINMATPPIEKPAFKTFEDNKKDFMAVANSLKLK
ncbi:hypothetical protein A3F02_02720 [Candidatus Curtissbacteria bacterium RIFCSPHIGHO2_12_FULL_38_9b]|uniref:Uncharacterized protein n=2 Tax=Candidatus Curtissiibacteriota TaxID=1752717 RepID=A0A1F5GUG1_9BACT|nr:MAG: hypothetical protein A3A48_03175 [Candidatus Curtissbacteria bacterium RIFCSPLOWO2_01_FULL_37_9]OGD95491.1 MAG: hypothetical protein A3F02_02720 [Candidatus Curtissbacteria bacterium RIFCSPHIGHO2_12_FULL_38_9b]